MRASAAVPVICAVVIGVMATAVPAHADSPVETIGQLEAEGFYVNIDRVGSAPLDQCIVTSVRNPQNQTRLIRVERFGKHGEKEFDLVPIVVRRTITVSLDCTK